MGMQANYKGAVAEALFVVYSARMGWECAKPIHPANGYDFVIRRSPTSNWETVQVKTAYAGISRPGTKVRWPTLRVNLRRQKNTCYKAGDFDWLFVVAPEGEQWLVPWSAVSSLRNTAIINHKRYSEYLLAA